MLRKYWMIFSLFVIIAKLIIKKNPYFFLDKFILIVVNLLKKCYRKNSFL